MASRNVETFREAHRAFNRRDFDAVAARMVDGFTYRDNARGMTYEGREGFKQFMSIWVSAFSNAEVCEPTYINGGDVVVAQFRGRGVNDGGMGPFRATGRAMDLPMCEILWFDADGRILSGAIYYDVMTMLTQLGIAPSPAPTGSVQ
jgi:steroid delta-isomerase-like uncharacterized protein